MILKIKKPCLFSLYVVSKSNRSNITNAVFIPKFQIQTMQQINEIGRFEGIGSKIAKEQMSNAYIRNFRRFQDVKDVHNKVFF